MEDLFIKMLDNHIDIDSVSLPQAGQPEKEDDDGEVESQ
jgi:hypothetical protein